MPFWYGDFIRVCPATSAVADGAACPTRAASLLVCGWELSGAGRRRGWLYGSWSSPGCATSGRAGRC
jgi:hypothetical protein